MHIRSRSCTTVSVSMTESEIVDAALMLLFSLARSLLGDEPSGRIALSQMSEMQFCIIGRICLCDARCRECSLSMLLGSEAAPCRIDRRRSLRLLLYSGGTMSRWACLCLSHRVRCEWNSRPVKR
jgi:hypothetical protein